MTSTTSKKSSLVQSFTIPGRLPGLNEYTRSCRGNKYGGNNVKQDAQTLVGIALRAARLRGVRAPVRMAFRWYEEDKRRDIDNIAFAKKFILDALVKTGILPDDSRKWLLSFVDEFPEPDKSNPRIEVEIEEAF